MSFWTCTISITIEQEHKHDLVTKVGLIMTSINSLTRELSSLDLQSKSANQPSVSKLLTKYAAPNPYKPSTSLRPKPKPGHQTVPSVSSNLNPSSIVKTSTLFDIGKYDGGLERDLDEKRGERVLSGEAEEDLALDSSVSK